MISLSAPALPAASILGLGAVTAMGRDLRGVAEKLSAPSPVAVAEAASPAATALRVPEDLLTHPRVGGRLRRADRFTRMAVVAALDAWEQARTVDNGDAAGPVGIILATGLGPQVRTFRFLDGILDFGDGSALPTDFSHSVHNAAAAYITEILELRGRSCTIADFESGFEQAVLLAQCWLAEGACARVLVGAVEELGQVMLNLAPQLLRGNGIVLGEGAVFLSLGPAGLAGHAQIDAAACPSATDLLIVDEPPVISPAALPCALALSAPQAATFTPYFGHTASGSAFSALGGLLSLRQRRVLGKTLRKECGPLMVNTAVTLKRLCNGGAATLLLANRGD